MRLTFMTLIFVFCLDANAQLTASLYDQNGAGVRIGTVVSTGDHPYGEGGRFIVAADDGYYMSVESSRTSAELFEGRLYYNNSFCFGIAYTTPDLRGQVFTHTSGGETVFYRSNLDVEPVSLSPDSYGTYYELTASQDPQFRCEPQGGELFGISADQVDPSDYRITEAKGFVAPVRMVMEAGLVGPAQGVFCDGFENCPTNTGSLELLGAD